MDSTTQAYLEQLQPESIIECSNAPWPALEEFCTEHSVPLQPIPPSHIFDTSTSHDLAIVHDIEDQLATDKREQILGYLRNCLARRVWLLASPESAWAFHVLLALGFKRDDEQFLGYDSYSYDIQSYNHRRTWNNPDYWANPENFHKYRW